MFKNGILCAQQAHRPHEFKSTNYVRLGESAKTL